MCKAASFIVLRGHKVLFHPVHDSHTEIIEYHKLHEGTVGTDVNFVPVEYSPPNGNLSLPFSEWIFKTDLPAKDYPRWYSPSLAERACYNELPAWAEKLRGVNLEEAFNPVNALKITPARLSSRHKKLLREWASVRASVRASVWDSVCGSVWDSVCGSVWYSVWDSVRASVRASVGDGVWASVRASVGYSVGDSVGDSVVAYSGGLFAGKIKKWKYAENLGPNPWKPLQDLWYDGYVPSFDGRSWRLHCWENAKIVYEWKPK